MRERLRWSSIVAGVREAARKRHTPREVGAAVGVGVCIGCSPFFGFHSVIAAGAAWLCGLNFVYVWAGTQISNPFFAAVLTATSIAVGRVIAPAHGKSVAQWSVDWLVGSMVVGVSLGAATGFATGIAVWGLQRRRARLEEAGVFNESL